MDMCVDMRVCMPGRPWIELCGDVCRYVVRHASVPQEPTTAHVQAGSARAGWQYSFLNPCLYACLYTCPYTFLHAILHTILYTCIRTCLYTSMCTCLFVCLYTWLHVCPRSCLYRCPYTCLYTCPYTCLHTCLYTCLERRRQRARRLSVAVYLRACVDEVTECARADRQARLNVRHCAAITI